MEFLRQLFQRYRNGESGSQEKQLVDVWYEAAGRFIKPSWMTRRHMERAEQKGWETISKQLGLIQPAASAATHSIRRLPVIMRYAAIVLLTGGSAWAIFLGYHQLEKAQGRLAAQNKKTLLTAGIGQQKRLQLPDGSIVWLNNSTTIALQEYHFRNDSVREIWLEEGEAFFEIAKNTGRPFIVHIDSIDTRVLGTSFTIQAYRTLPDMQITVLSGKVLIAKRKRMLGTLNKNSQLIYKRFTDSATTTLKEADNKEAAWWNGGRFILDHTGFDELSLRIKARYGVQLQSNNHRILNTSFSAGFDRNTSLKQVLDVLCVIYKTSYTVKRDNTIIIH